jgi:hypothetical protein
MKRFSKGALVIGAALMAASGSVAFAQAAGGKDSAQATPKGWNYEIKDGKRVPKGDRVTNADGSWREETRQGSCVTVKEKTAGGEYKESRRCD